MAERIGNSRDFFLKNLVLKTAKTSVDIRLITTELSYQEDIFKNTCHGYVMLTEASGYVETLQLSGTETLQMVLGKTSSSEIILKNFSVYKIDKRKLTGNMQSESYLLYFCSKQMMLAESKKINKSYSNMDISSIVKDIAKEINITKINTGGTYGNYSFVIPHLNPLDAINWLSVYALPPVGNVGADMLFFENKDGFNFLSLQQMVDSGSSFYKEYGSYSYNPKNLDTKNLQQQVQTAFTYELLSSFDTLHALKAGTFANRLISVDILSRKKKETKFNYLDYFNSELKAKLNDYPATNDTYSDVDPVLKLVYSNFDQHTNSVVQANPGCVAPNINAETYIPYRTAQLNLINYQRMKISVPGDPNLTVGRVTNFLLQSKNPGQKSGDAYYSGKYLITATRHMITQTSYTTVMELAKESVPTKYGNAT